MNCMRIGKTENRKCNIEKHTNTQRSKMLKTIMFLWRHTVAHYRFERKRERRKLKKNLLNAMTVTHVSSVHITDHHTQKHQMHFIYDRLNWERKKSHRLIFSCYFATSI